MADDVTKDRARISMTEAREVRYWTKELGVSKERLESETLPKRHGANLANRSFWTIGARPTCPTPPHVV